MTLSFPRSYIPTKSDNNGVYVKMEASPQSSAHYQIAYTIQLSYLAHITVLDKWMIALDYH